MDYTLSIDTSLCIFAYSHLVSAPSPCHSLKNGVGAWFRIVSVFIVVSLPTDFPSSRPTLSQWGLEDECVLLKNPKDSNSLVSARLSLSLGVLPLHMGLARVLPRTVWLIGNHVDWSYQSIQFAHDGEQGRPLMGHGDNTLFL